MLTIQKHFPIGKGISVGSLALVAGFLSSVTVLNMLYGTTPESEPMAQVRTNTNTDVLGASTNSDAAVQNNGSGSTASGSETSTGQVSGLSWRNASSGSVQQEPIITDMPVAPQPEEVVVPANPTLPEPLDPPTDPDLPLNPLPIINDIVPQAQLDLGGTVQIGL